MPGQGQGKSKPKPTKHLAVNGQIVSSKAKTKLRHYKTWKQIQDRIREIQAQHAAQ